MTILTILILVSLTMNIILINTIKKDTIDIMNIKNDLIENINDINTGYNWLNKQIDIIAQLSINQSTDIDYLKKNKVELDLYQHDIVSITTDLNTILLLSINSIETYGNGIKLNIKIGNPTNITYEGFSFSVDAYDIEKTKTEYSSIEKEDNLILPGWNNYDIILDSFDMQKYTKISIDSFTINSLSMYVN